MSNNLETEASQELHYDKHRSIEYPPESSLLIHSRSSEEVFPSLYRSLLFMFISIILIESLVEIVLVDLFHINIWYHILLDSGFMIIILSPFLYHFLYLPYKRHHEYHRTAQSQIHYLSRQLINIAEKERKDLSHNLHDGFGQVLTAMQFEIETIKCSCLVEGDKNEVCLAQTNKLSQQISDLGDYVRDVSTILHPHMLEELGLAATLKWYIETISREHEELNIELSLPEFEGHFPPEIELAIFRICQESLNNIVKHAKAKKVTVGLSQMNDDLTLSIEDDGEGFDLKVLQAVGEKRSGIGILGMRERAADLGGLFSLDSTPGKGTTIHLTTPAKLRRRKHEGYTDSDC